MRTVLLQKFTRKDVGNIHRKMFSQNRCSFKPILDFDNKLMEGTKTFHKLWVEDLRKRVQFYTAKQVNVS